MASLTLARGPARSLKTWWAALIVLLLNDHVLKGSGVLPGVVTGKLSDFAGLIVAPVLLCMLLRVRSDRGRALACALVGAAFAAIKLSPQLAHDAAELLTRLGVPSRIWCDPTDLLALTVLPFAFRIARGLQAASVAPAAPHARWTQRLTIALAACACIATSDDSPQETQLFPPFVINWTRAPIDVEISTQTFPCSAVIDADEDADDEDAGDEDAGSEGSRDPDPADAGDPGIARSPARTVRLEPRELYSLVSGLGLATLAPGRCGRAELRAQGAEPLRVSWTARASIPIDESVYQRHVDGGENRLLQIAPNDDWAFELAVTLGGSSRAPTWIVGADLSDGWSL